MELIIKIKNPNCLIIKLRDHLVVDRETLTIDQKLDNMLISSIDKLLKKNTIERLSLKSMEIRGKLRSEAVSSMILKTISSALRA